jgi:Ca2+/Na+ antiporter
MKNRITDYIVIFLIAIFYIVTLNTPEYLGGNIGRIITGIFIIISILLSWKFSAEQNMAIKVVVYLFQFSILFLFSAIITELFTGISGNFYFNIIFLLVALLCYYFFLFKKLYKSIKRPN